MTNNLPKMSGPTGYSLGFFCGCLVGVVGTYLAVAPDGKRLKQQLLAEFQANLELIRKDSAVPAPTSTPLRDLLNKARRLLTPANLSKPTIKTQSTQDQSKKKHYFKKK